MDEQATQTEVSPPSVSDELAPDTTFESPATEGALDPVDVATEPGEGLAEPGPIPYSRFKEVNETAKTLKAQMEQQQAILKEFGFESVEQMREAALLEQQRMEEERIKTYFQAQVEEGELDEDTANLRRDLELERMAFQRERAQVQQFFTEQAKAQALEAHPSAKPLADVVDGLIRGGADPQAAVQIVATIADRVSLAVKSQTVAAKPVAPPPMGTDNQSAQPTAPVSPLDQMRKVKSMSWRELLSGGSDKL